MWIIIIVTVLFFVYLYIKESYKYGYVKEKSMFEISKIEKQLIDEPNNVIQYCRRAFYYQRIQDFKKSSDDYLYALRLIKEGKLNNDNKFRADTLVGKILVGLKFNEKPFPGASKGPKDKTGSILYFALIERIGEMRHTFK